MSYTTYHLVRPKLGEEAVSGTPKEALIKSVIPAKLVLECLNRGAGIHLDLKRGFIESKWIPAFAGMTIYGLNQSFPKPISGG